MKIEDKDLEEMARAAWRVCIDDKKVVIRGWRTTRGSTVIATCLSVFILLKEDEEIQEVRYYFKEPRRGGRGERQQEVAFIEHKAPRMLKASFGDMLEGNSFPSFDGVQKVFLELFKKGQQEVAIQVINESSGGMGPRWDPCEMIWRPERLWIICALERMYGAWCDRLKDAEHVALDRFESAIAEYKREMERYVK